MADAGLGTREPNRAPTAVGSAGNIRRDDSAAHIFISMDCNGIFSIVKKSKRGSDSNGTETYYLALNCLSDLQQ